jgi:diguanylate cyclase (GGDEF)-like protein
MRCQATRFDPTGTRSLARLGGWLFLAGGCVAGAAAPALRGTTNIALAAAASVAAGLVVLVIPWERLPRQALYVETLVALTITAGLGRAQPDVVHDFLSMYVLILAYVGLMQSLRWIPLTAVLATAGYGFSVSGSGEGSVDFAVTIAVGTLLAIVLAGARARVEAAHSQAEQLLAATRALTKATSELSTCTVLQDLVRDSLQADVVMVFLADGLGSTRYVNACPTPVGLPDTVSIDVGAERSGIDAALDTGAPFFVPDARRETRISSRLVSLIGAESLLFVPLLGEEGRLGAVVVVWRKPVRVLDAFAERLIEILSTEASSVLERQRQTSRANQLAETDPLTGLFNRRTVDARLRNLEQGDALVMVDLDHFKRLNDRYGHAVGDKELVRLASCMLNVSREGDVSGRIGGEEFLFILRRAGFKGGTKTVERLREAWAEADALTTFSAGISVHEAGADPRQTLAQADDALYFAKRSGRDTYHLFVNERPSQDQAAGDLVAQTTLEPTAPLREQPVDRRFDRPSRPLPATPRP